MDFSIVTISYNQLKYLERTILSVIEQQGVEIEYILVDPGSTDGSRLLIEDYKNKISKVILKPDSGPAEGLNNGFNEAKGEIFGYLNSDDLYLEGSLVKIRDYFKSNPNVDVVIGNGFQIDQNDKVIRKIFSDKFSLIKYKLGVCNFIQPSMFIRNSAFKKVGGFNVDNKTCWDAELLVNLAHNGLNIQNLNYYISKFRIHTDSISGSGRLYTEYVEDRKRICAGIEVPRIIENNFLFVLLFRFNNFLQNPIKLFSKFNLGCYEKS